MCFEESASDFIIFFVAVQRIQQVGMREVEYGRGSNVINHFVERSHLFVVYREGFWLSFLLYFV